MATLRSEITELANTLNKVQQLATEANTERELRKLVHLLMVLWEEVIRQDLEPTQEIYLNALHALALAAAAAQDAYADITKVTTAISSMAAITMT